MKKILLGLFILSFLLVGYNVQATETSTDKEIVCCESYATVLNPVKVYSLMEKSQCSVPLGSNGGAKNIVNDSFCKTNTPVISGVSGPQAIKLGQKGEWKVRASAPMGGSLTYEVVWGDEVTQIADLNTSTKQATQQTSTFTHVYNKAGTYNPKFIVTSENTIRCVTTPCPSNGGSASVSISVVVSNSTSVCPVGCLCDGDNIACPDPVEKEDKGCLLGYKFSPKTGEVCPTLPVKDGCMPGYKYSPMTGDVCPVTVDDEEDKKIEDKKTCTEPGSNCGVRNYGISRILRHGVKGEDVKTLQSILNLTQDGVFGPITKEKLIEWQKEHGLNPDGVFGPNSLEKAEIED
jgi:hypothetical protein